MDRIDEAEALLALGLEHHRDSPQLVEQHAFCAHQSGRYREALDRWRRLRALRPDRPMAWCGIAANARELAMLDEATTTIDEALRRFAGDVLVVTEAARIRERCGAYAEAAELWRAVLAHPGSDASWHLAVARNLMMLDRFDEVEAILETLHAEHDPGSAQVRRDLARQWCQLAAAAETSDRIRYVRQTAEAVPRFGDEAYAIGHVADTVTDLAAARKALKGLLETTPDDVEAHASYVHVLVRSELLRDAARQVRMSLRLFPEDETLLRLQGSIALRRQDWDGAYAAAAAQAQQNPHDNAAADRLDRMRRLQRLETAERTPGSARLVPIAPPLVDDPALRRLVLTFESFGQDCEFGTVQRLYGAEPLSLLRFTETDAVSLTHALTARFAGMGDPQQTELIVGSAGEIQIRDTRFRFAMHTFLYASEVAIEVLHAKMCRRTAYLRDKLLGDLRRGEKTVVFKSSLLAADDLLALHDALLTLGPNCLLHVRPAGAGTRGAPSGAPGAVEVIRPGLFVGYLSRMGDLDDVAYDEWVMICRSVEELRARSTASAASPSLAA